MIKSSDEDMSIFLLVVFYLLEQNRQNRILSMLYFPLEAFMVRNSKMCIATPRYFANMYQNEQALVYHKQDNDFNVFCSTDLNIGKYLDPQYRSFDK